MPSTYYSLCCTLAALFVWAGWLNLFGPAFIAQEFRSWKYPDWLRVAVGVAEWSIAAMLLLQLAPRLAILLAAAIVVAVIITLFRHGLFMRLETPFLLIALLAIVYPSSPALGLAGI